MALAWPVVRALRQIRETQGNPDLPLRLLDIGTGCGVIAAAAACMDNLEVVGFDKDPFAVELARNNIQQAIQTRNVQGTTAQTFVGDWNEPEFWERLSVAFPGGFDAIVANPPFKKPVDRSTLRPAYQEVPDDAYFTPPNDQYAHYRTIFPHATRLLSDRPGAMAAFRYPLEEEQERGWGPFDDLNYLLAAAAAKADPEAAWAISGDSIAVSPQRVLTHAELYRWPLNWHELTSRLGEQAVRYIGITAERFEQVRSGLPMYEQLWHQTPIYQTLYFPKDFPPTEVKG